MKNPTITFFPTADRIAISIADDEFNTLDCTMNAELLKRVLMHPNHQLQGVSWSDTPNHVGYYPYGNLLICSQEFVDILGNHPLEVERLFKRCFQNVLPELYGAEIKDVRIQVYHLSTHDAE